MQKVEPSPERPAGGGGADQLVENHKQCVNAFVSISKYQGDTLFCVNTLEKPEEHVVITGIIKKIIAIELI